MRRRTLLGGGLATAGLALGAPWTATAAPGAAPTCADGEEAALVPNGIIHPEQAKACKG